MKYRELGNTGLKVSEIGMGCEGFAEDRCRMTKKLFDTAEANGVNYFDLYTSNPDVRRAVGEALVGRREKFYIHYALTRPAVATVLAGAHSTEQFLTSLAYEDAGDAERDYAAAFASFPRIRWQGHCMYCSHCAPCPQKINVADVTKFLHLAEAQNGVPETVREHYALLPHHAEECVQCGVCEKACPQHIAIRAELEAVAKALA